MPMASAIRPKEAVMRRSFRSLVSKLSNETCGSSAAAARMSIGCSHVQSNNNGATMAQKNPPMTPPTDIIR
jgi:hypothetical protein